MLPAGSERDSRYDQIKNISIQVFLIMHLIVLLLCLLVQFNIMTCYNCTRVFY